MHKIDMAFLRGIKNFLEIPKLKGSKNASNEVNPAKKTAKKNNGPITYAVSPIILKIFGNTTNKRPVPLVAISFNDIPLSLTIKPSILNTPNAVKISNREFAITTSSTLSISFVFSGR